MRGGDIMKKVWQKPELEVLSINMTALGNNNGAVDFSYTDRSDNEVAELHS